LDINKLRGDAECDISNVTTLERSQAFEHAAPLGRFRGKARWDGDNLAFRGNLAP
jgi:hypothetical protein